MAWLFLPENEQVQYLQKIAAQKIHLVTKQLTQCHQISAIGARDEAIFTRIRV
jgi:hypothetical protein